TQSITTETKGMHPLEQQAITPIINKITPSPVIGINKRQWIEIKGEFINTKTVLILSWTNKGKQQHKQFSLNMPSKQLQMDEANHLRLHINTGTSEKIWQVQLKNQNKESINYQFKVVEPFQPTKTDLVPQKQKIISSGKKSQATTTAKKIVKSQNYILQQPDSFFTLQLLGSSNNSAIQKVLTKHKDHQKLFGYKSIRKSKDWYILIYGSYSSKQKAQQAYKKLPKSLKTTKPWVRNIKSVKQQLQNNFDRGDVKQVKQMLDKKNKPPSGSKKPLAIKVLIKDLATMQSSISSMAVDKWAYQLISLSAESAMLDYMKTHKLQDKGKYFKRKVNGTSRYTLVYGIFDSKQQAQDNLKNLPAIIRQGKPWIRSYGDIQKLIQ
ncbi:MAG: SPOR domain-containing protein, partial [Pseudomonadota bacterium]